MLHNLDVSIFDLINQTMQNPVFDAVMPLIAQYGYYTWMGLVVLVGFLDRRSGIANAHLLLTSLLAGWVLTEEVLKPLFHRPRPYMGLLSAHAHLLVPLQSNSSFPSGAVAMSFATLVPFVVCYWQSKTASLAIAWGCLIMLSRVYVGAHYPSDVLGGVVLGTIVGAIAVRLNMAEQNQKLPD